MLIFLHFISMKIITIPIIIIGIIGLLCLFFPVLFLEATEPVLDSEMRIQAGLFLAEFSLEIRRYDTVSDIYDYLISLNPAPADYYNKKSMALQKSGRIDEALIALDAALARDPHNVEYLLRKARMARSIGNNDISDRTYEEIEQIIPARQSDLVYMGDAALDKNHYLNAYERYTKATIVNPKDADTLEKRGDIIFLLLSLPTASRDADQALIDLNLYDEGIKSYQNALALDPKKAADINSKLEKRSDIFTPKSIAELKSRYTEYRFV